MISQPAFLAFATAQSGIAEDTDVTILFGTEVFDQGGNFASNTFTAPVTGRYQLNLNIRLDDIDIDSGYYYLKIITSNRQYRTILSPGAFDADPNYWGMSESVLADMDASDTVYCVIYQEASGAVQTAITNEANFSGYLVC